MSSEHEYGSVHRRDVICGGGGAVLGLMVATLLGGTKPVRAAGVTGAIPEIDGLACAWLLTATSLLLLRVGKAATWTSNTSAGALGAASHRAGRSSANSACRCTGL